jgi:hypothetical protein
MILGSIEKSGKMISNIVWSKDMCVVINAKSGYGGSTTSIEEDKVLDIVGIRNVHGVQRMVTTSVLTKEYVMSW